MGSARAGARADRMNASIIAIGSEMLGPTRVDTNSLKITTALEDFGVTLTRKSVIGDRLDDLAGEIRHCIDRSDILVTSGGLGPTEDDLTREALAKAFKLKMELEPSNRRSHREALRRARLQDAGGQ